METVLMAGFPLKKSMETAVVRNCVEIAPRGPPVH